MTADADSLRAMGALHSLEVPEAELCSAANVDSAALVQYVRIAVAEFVPPLSNAELVEHQVRQTPLAPCARRQPSWALHRPCPTG